MEFSVASSPVDSWSNERTKQIKLSTKGLENAALLGINDFTLRLGSEQFECSRFEASFLSPRIAAVLLQDPTTEEYEIEMDPDHEIDGECVNGLIALARNGSIEITQSNFDLLAHLAKSLGNSELCEALQQFRTEGVEVNSSNVGERLAIGEVLDICVSGELDYLSAHFYEIDPSILRQIGDDHLRDILRSAQLRLSSEDALLEFILDLGPGHLDLLGCLQTEYLSDIGMERLLESISPAEIEDDLWQSLCRRLLSFVPSRPRSETRFEDLVFPFDRWQRFNGIIDYLTAECGGNVHTEGNVAITASSTMHNACHQVADYYRTDYWFSQNQPNSWIQFDFKSRRVSPTHYTIKSDRDVRGHLVNW
jgi:hypothetical protein